MQGPQQLHPVVGLHRDVERGDERAHPGSCGGGHHAVGQRGRVGQLRGVGALGPSAPEAVDVEPVAADQVGVDGGGEGRDTLVWVEAVAVSPAARRSSPIRRKALTARMFSVVSALVS